MAYDTIVTTLATLSLSCRNSNKRSMSGQNFSVRRWYSRLLANGGFAERMPGATTDPQQRGPQPRLSFRPASTVRFLGFAYQRERSQELRYPLPW